MAGNSSRRGAVARSKKGPSAGTGGNNKRRLSGRGPTPKAEDREYHPAAKKKAAKSAEKPVRRSATTPPPRTRPPQRTQRRGKRDGNEVIAGRNSVVEALRARVPAKELTIASRIDVDDRVREALNLALGLGINVREVPRSELDRETEGAVHQGIALSIPPYEYADLEDLLDAAGDQGVVLLLVALDGVTDPRNLGAIIRSAAAFGAHGVVIPERRSASMTSSAWKTAAGAATRVPVARVTNLVRAIEKAKQSGCLVVGLDADGDLALSEFKDGADPLMLVIGSEGQGLSRLVGETCDLIVSIPMHAATESLNASVAAGIALHAIADART